MGFTASPMAGLYHEADDDGRGAAEAILNTLTDGTAERVVPFVELKTHAPLLVYGLLELWVDNFAQLKRHVALPDNVAQDVWLGRTTGLDGHAIEPRSLSEQAEDGAFAFFLFVSGTHGATPALASTQRFAQSSPCSARSGVSL
jgi:hypothetical protein